MRGRAPSGFEDVTLDCAGVLTGWQPLGTCGRLRVHARRPRRAQLRAAGQLRQRPPRDRGAPALRADVWGWGSAGSRAGSTPSTSATPTRRARAFSRSTTSSWWSDESPFMDLRACRWSRWWCSSLARQQRPRGLQDGRCRDGGGGGRTGITGSAGGRRRRRGKPRRRLSGGWLQSAHVQERLLRERRRVPSGTHRRSAERAASSA